MRIIPNISTLQKGILLYRKIRYRKGFGVHSPFAFNLITKVVEEKCSYYSFHDIESLREQLRGQKDLITYIDLQQKKKLRTCSIGEIVARKAISPKHGALLFRLTNYFKSANILQIGSGMGLSTLYLTTYATGLNCTVLENIPEFAQIARQAYSKQSRNRINLQVGKYKELLPAALEEIKTVDLVFFNTLYEQQDNMRLFNECVKHAHNDTIFILEGIRSNRKARELWKKIATHPEVVISLDLFALGIVFFNKKLHKKDYKVYF